jgi:hypothetical protein
LWRQPLIERHNQVSPLRDIELFAEPVRSFVAEFSATAGLGRIIRPYAARDCRASDSDGAALHVGVDAFDVMVSLAAGRSLEHGVATDVSRLLDVFPHYGPPCTARRGGTLLFRIV